MKITFSTWVFWIGFLGWMGNSPVLAQQLPALRIESVIALPASESKTEFQAVSKVEIRGKVERAGSGRSRIFCEDRIFQVGEDGGFRLEVLSPPDATVLDLVWIGASGEVVNQSVPVPVRAMTLSEVPKGVHAETPRRSRFKVGAGVTQIRYNQTERTTSVSSSSTALTLSGAYRYALVPSVWDLSASGYINVVTLSSQGGTDFRFMGGNLRAGYLFPRLQGPWHFALYGGWYYSDMIASVSGFGYRHLTGPQVCPVVRRDFSNGSSISAYLKFSWIMQSLAVPGFENHEYAGGMSWSFNAWKKTFELSLDHSRLRFGQNTSKIDTGNWSLGLGLVF